MLPSDDPGVQSLTKAVQGGDVEAVRALVGDRPELATDRHGDTSQSRTALHIATDWPGNFPRVAETIAVLIAAGAPVNGRFAGPHEETPLHWAASSDDVAAIDALLAAGADIEATGAVLTGGTPLADAVVFAQWNAARRLQQAGPRMTIWQAAALGAVDEIERLLANGECGDGDITNAAWHACRAGQLAAVQLLAEHGADLDWLGYEEQTSRQAGLASASGELRAWLTEQS